MHKLYLGGYWRPRRESLQKCLGKLERWIAATKTSATKSLTWHESTRGRKPSPPIAEPSQLADVVQRSRSFTDVGHRLLKELGFEPSLCLRRGNKTIARCSIRCGCVVEGIKNLVLIEGVEQVIKTDELARYQQALTSVAEIWEPDWIGVFSHHALGKRPDANLPFVDWMVYLSSELMPEPPKLKSPAIAEPCADGTLIIVQEEPRNPEDAAQQRHVKRVAKKVWEAVITADADASS